LNGDDRWGTYPINQAGEIEIRPGRGDWAETPVYDSRADRRKQGMRFPIPFIGPWRIWRGKYVEYDRLSKRLLLRTDTEYHGIDLPFLEKILKGKALAAYTEPEKTGIWDYLIFGGIALLILYVVVIPNIG
jgi:hypothetical protein